MFTEYLHRHAECTKNTNCSVMREQYEVIFFSYFCKRKTKQLENGVSQTFPSFASQSYVRLAQSNTSITAKCSCIIILGNTRD